jgi:hypothetical protein
VEDVNLKSKIGLFALSLIVTILPYVTVQAITVGAEANVFAYPEKSTVKINATFQVFVNVSAVSKLQGFDFMLTYDSRLLSCLGVEEGSLLSAFGPTFVAKREINDTYGKNLGRVWYAAVIYGTGFADGNGTLAVITFKAVSAGQTLLDLYSSFPLRPDMVKLTTCGSQSIPNKAIDGSVTIVAGDPGDPSDPPPTEITNRLAILPNVDINGDGVVNIEDLVFVAGAFGAAQDDPRYRAEADLDLNGIVDIRDLSLVALNYMRTI